MKQELKDKTYVLTGDATPIAFMLASRHTRNSPLLWFDEEKGVNRALRYARNQKSPFEDEQDGNAILEHVTFTDGNLTVPRSNQVLQKFLEMHPGYGSIFVELDYEKIAKEEVKNLNMEVDALIMARGLDIDTAEAVLRVMTDANVDKMTSDEVKRDILVYARNNPSEFLEAVDDPQLKLYSTAGKALSSGLFVTKNSGRDIYYNLPNNKKKLISIPFGEEAVSALVAFLTTDDGIEVLKMIEKQTK